MKIHDPVILVKDLEYMDDALQTKHLRTGTTGVMVDGPFNNISHAGDHYLIEFFSEPGVTVAVVMVEKSYLGTLHNG